MQSLLKIKELLKIDINLIKSIIAQKQEGRKQTIEILQERFDESFLLMIRKWSSAYIFGIKQNKRSSD